MTDRKLKIGITHGDTAGIGYEVILKALDDPRMVELCTPIIYGSARMASKTIHSLELEPIQLNQIADPMQASPEKVNIINVVDESAQITPGSPTAESGANALAALQRAVDDLRQGRIDALVTAPIDKHNIQSDSFSFPGHTEYLEAQLEANPGDALMILCNDSVRVALVTIHQPIAKVAEMITRQAVLQKIQAFNRSLTSDFGIGHPRIAVLALNPHSGDQGLIGSEEQTEIIPAIQDAQAQRINAFGPYSADGFWGSGQWQKFDGVLAMYHDQGLAPFKTLAMDAGVNFTAGLEAVRTSPDHGTAFDIAGKGEASPQSMRQAIYTAIDVVRNRARHQQAFANPLKRQYVERNKKDNVVLDLTKD